VNDPKIIMKVARQFAERVAAYVSERFDGYAIEKIDSRNRNEKSPDICHSHDFCDANVHMQLAILDVTGIDAAAQMPEMSDDVSALWHGAWNAAKRIGFRRLSAVRGMPDIPPEEPVVKYLSLIHI
jgi:hypothetical protein